MDAHFVRRRSCAQGLALGAAPSAAPSPADGGRIHARLGGLAKDQVTVHDGQR